MPVIFLRGILLYLLLTLTFRFMGKRQVGELEVSDLVTTLLLSEIAALPIEDPDMPLSYALIPILLIMCLEVMITFLEIKCNPLKKLLEEKPVMLISKGKMQPEALRKMRISVDELISECRLQGIGNISEVNYAILEPNGKLSVFPKTAYSPITPSILHKKTKENGILHYLVMDGTPQKETLKKLGLSQDRLEEMCKEKGGKMEEMFLFGIDDGGQILAVRREEVEH